VLDGLDGTVARVQKTAGRRGSFTDTFADQCVLAGVVLTLIAGGLLSVWTGGLFLFAYTLVVVFAMVRNALDVPYRFLVRPRFVLYVAIPFQLWARLPVLEPLTAVLAVFLLVKTVSGYLAIRRAL
jgi:phosphatidylglycerophosphate synthase